MTFPADASERSPKGDHNRRLALGLAPEDLAYHAGISVDELREYEFTAPDAHFDTGIAERVGAAIERLEAALEPIVDNGGVPGEPRRSPPPHRPI